MGNGETERRRWKRFFLRVEDADNHCTIKDGQGRECAARLKDISVGGACLELVRDESGACLELAPDAEIEFGPCGVAKWGRYVSGARGFVRWVRGNECGCQFHVPLGVPVTRA